MGGKSSEACFRTECKEDVPGQADGLTGKETTMPFGSFYAENTIKKPVQPAKEKAGRKAPQAPAKAEPVVRWEYNVTLICRTQQHAREFLCSMNENMNQVASRHGLSFYIPDHNTMRTISGERQKINSFFRSFSEEDWTYTADEREAAGRYVFEIAPAGVQKKAIRINIQAVSGAQTAAPKGYDTLWILADASSLLPERAQEDPYTQNLQSILGGLPQWEENAPRPVCLILTQFEATGEESGIMRYRAADVMVSRGWRSVFTGAAGDGTMPAVMAAQIFGGLRFERSGEDFLPVLKMSANIKKYRPSGCHIPMLYALQNSAFTKGSDFFADSMDGGLFSAILGCYEDQFSNPSWKPEILAGGEAE